MEKEGSKKILIIGGAILMIIGFLLLVFVKKRNTMMSYSNFNLKKVVQHKTAKIKVAKLRNGLFSFSENSRYSSTKLYHQVSVFLDDDTEIELEDVFVQKLDYLKLNQAYSFYIHEMSSRSGLPFDEIIYLTEREDLDTMTHSSLIIEPKRGVLKEFKDTTFSVKCYKQEPEAIKDTLIDIAYKKMKFDMGSNNEILFLRVDGMSLISGRNYYYAGLDLFKKETMESIPQQKVELMWYTIYPPHNRQELLAHPHPHD